jgi:hypothetical protein
MPRLLRRGRFIRHNLRHQIMKEAPVKAEPIGGIVLPLIVMLIFVLILMCIAR